MRITSEQLIQGMQDNFYDFMNNRIYEPLNKDSFVLEREICLMQPSNKWETSEYLIEQLIDAKYRGLIRFDQNPDDPANNRVYITFKGLWFVKTYLAGQRLKP